MLSTESQLNCILIILCIYEVKKSISCLKCHFWSCVENGLNCIRGVKIRKSLESLWQISVKSWSWTERGSMEV